MANEIDINENNLLLQYPEVLQTLLRDHSRFDHLREKLRRAGKDPKEAEGREDECHIIWATDDYESFGEGFSFHDQISIENITGEHAMMVRPRVLKTLEEQNQRSKDMAEVLTPSWVCNAQNNLIDEAWFGRPNVFNTEYVDENGEHLWTPTEGKIQFDNKNSERSWQAYVKDTRMEMTCGEAPYIVSRYDTVSGNRIPVSHRIGLLDRKLRVISENVDNKGEWMKMAKEALKATYGFEWQGDNLLLAREAIFYSIIDYYKEKFGEEPAKRSLPGLAYIISWNIWQMDGLKMVIPDTCHDDIAVTQSLFGDEERIVISCPGCKSGEHRLHNGIKCRVRDWNYSGKVWDKERPYFYTLLQNHKL